MGKIITHMMQPGTTLALHQVMLKGGPDGDKFAKTYDRRLVDCSTCLKLLEDIPPLIAKGSAWPWDAMLTVPEGWVRLDKRSFLMHASITIFATRDHDEPPKMVDTTLRNVRANENNERSILFGEVNRG